MTRRIPTSTSRPPTSLRLLIGPAIVLLAAAAPARAHPDAGARSPAAHPAHVAHPSEHRAAPSGSRRGPATPPATTHQHTSSPAACLQADRRPVLSVADFDGSGIVDGADLRALAERVLARDTVAFFDLDADGQVGAADLLRAALQIGQRSTPLDREVAAVFRATERYRDIHHAIADGFIPFTASGIGHGVHWARPQPSYRFELTAPTGLNYSEDGRLLAVFYGQTVEPGQPDRPPTGFGAGEPWHDHVNACFGGVDPAHPTFNFQSLHFEECVPRAACRAALWLPKFYMIHLWIYEQNPCGLFGLTNPRITTGIDPALASTRCPEGGGHEGAHGVHAR